MKLSTMLAILVIVALAAGAGFVYSGAYDIAADEPHWPLTSGLIGTLRDRSVAARSSGIEVPPDLDSADRIQRGAGNYDAMCTGCHLKPGVHSSEIRKGLYPQPPDLSQAAPGPAPTAADAARAAARRFWTIKHGIKMTAMPAWSMGGMDDDTIWDMVALLQKLPTMDGNDYAALVAASEGHTHMGAEGGHDHGDASAPAGHVDPPEAPPHSHDDAPAPKKQGDGHDHAH